MPAKFSLAGLLRLRGIQQDQAAGVLAAAHREVNDVERRVASTAERLAGSGSTPGTPEALMAIAAARASARSMFLELDGLHTQALTRADTARSDYSQAKTATAALEKLADRHTVQSAAEELRAEQNALDEIAVRSGAPVGSDRA